jgi:hypothetical protein
LTERPGSTPGLFSWALLHSPSLEETGIRGVLLDIGGIALFGGIHFGFCLRHLFGYFGIAGLAGDLSPLADHVQHDRANL